MPVIASEAKQSLEFS